MNTRADRDDYKLTTYGLAADGKPENVANGHLHVEMDTGKEYRYDEENDTWYEQPAGGGGGSGLPDVTAADKDKYLHTNASTGALEWVSIPPANGEDF